MADEFKATHRYLGGDDGQFLLSVGEEVMFVSDWRPTKGRMNGDYINADGYGQTVWNDCMEEL